MYKETDKKAELLLRLERNIEVGERNFFAIHPECFVFRYSHAGKFKTVVFEKGLSAAKLLYKYQKIDTMPALKADGSVAMFNTSFIASSGAKGEVVWLKLKSPFRWEDAHFTQREAIEICTLAEFEEASQQAGGVLGSVCKVIDMIINKAA